MTREEAKKIVHSVFLNYLPFDGDKKADEVIETLEQDSIIDKIKAEIEALPKTYPFVNHIDMYVKVSDVTKIIEKYKAESNG
jgi:hypothetical protein